MLSAMQKRSDRSLLNLQASALKVSPELSGSKLYERWNAVVHSPDAQTDGAGDAASATPYFADVLHASNDASYALADAKSASQEALTPLPLGCHVELSKFGTFLLTDAERTTLGLPQAAS